MDCLKKKKTNRNTNKMQVREQVLKVRKNMVNAGHLPYEIQETKPSLWRGREGLFLGAKPPEKAQ